MINDRPTRDIAKYMKDHDKDVLSMKARTGHFNPEDGKPKAKALKKAKFKYHS